MTYFHANFENATVTPQQADRVALMILQRPDRQHAQTYLDALGIERDA